VTPHGRDYQTLPDGSYAVAREQHRAHLINLDAALAYAEALANSIINPEG
jgi:DNA gyrase inhibitor GyrI